jgi:GAF domain-containing protein
VPPSAIRSTLISATHGQRAAVASGGRWSFDSSPLGRRIVETARPVRINDWTGLPGEIAARHRDEGFGQAVAAPIIVNGAVWGYIGAFSEASDVLPPDCETRLADYTQLMASAISNAEARENLRRLADEQGALRRVATLVAQGAEPRSVFTTIAVEASRLLGVGAVSLISYDAGTQMYTKIFGTHGDRSPVPDGTTWPVEDCPEGIVVLRTGRPGRVDD